MVWGMDGMLEATCNVQRWLYYGTSGVPRRTLRCDTLQWYIVGWASRTRRV